MREIVGSGWHPSEEEESESGLIVDLAFGFPNIPDQNPNLSTEEQKKVAKRKFPFGRPRLFVSILDPMPEADGDKLKVKGVNHPIASIRRSERFEAVAFDFTTGLHRTDIGLTEHVGNGLEIHYDADDEAAGVALNQAIDLECELGILGLQLVDRRYRRQQMTDEGVAIGRYGGYHDSAEHGSINKMKIHVRELEDTSNDNN